MASESGAKSPLPGREDAGVQEEEWQSGGPGAPASGLLPWTTSVLSARRESAITFTTSPGTISGSWHGQGHEGPEPEVADFNEGCLRSLDQTYATIPTPPLDGTS